MKKRYVLAMVAVGLLFTCLRVYKLNTSLLFFNDIGRDYWTLYNWQQTLKPPLLGPQTSALPYNQSAVYFYLLMPMFLLTGQSLYSSVFTLIIFYLGGFGILYYLTKNNQKFQIPVIISLLLLTIHPQVIIQNRFVWNPSFLPILILIAIVSWLLLLQSWKHKYLLIFSLSSALAVSLNYSAGPAFFAFILVSAVVLKSKKKLLWLVTTLGSALLFFNLPTIFFEIRHKFLLTNLLLHGEKLPQTAISWYEKTTKLISFSMTNISPRVQLIVGIYFLITIAAHLFTKSRSFSPLFRSSIYLFMTTIVITLIVPISIQAHYIFAVLTIGIFALSLLRPKLLVPLVAVLVIVWLKPSQVQTYFRPAYRSFKQSLNCAQQICGNITEPIFVSVQSDLHPYHNGMEWKYLLARSGCVVKELDTQIDQANTMVVVVDHSEYQHGKTAYNELTQFGKSKEVSHIYCSNSLWAAILKR